MAIVQNPITGRSSGKFASAIFQTQYGRNVLRSKPVKVANPNTAEQQDVRSKFAAAVAWVRMFLTIIRTGFSSVAEGMSSYSAALSWYLINAMTKVGVSWQIDIPSARFIFGELQPLAPYDRGQVSSTIVYVSFPSSRPPGNGSDDDPIFMIFYNSTQSIIAHLDSANIREHGAIEATVPEMQVGDVIYMWIYAKNTEGTLISDDAYAGTFTFSS